MQRRVDFDWPFRRFRRTLPVWRVHGSVLVDLLLLDDEVTAKHAVLLLQGIVLLGFLEELDVRKLLIAEYLLYLAV